MDLIYIYYFLFGAFIIMFEFLRKKEGRYDFLSFANGFYLITYCITPIYFLDIFDNYSHQNEVRIESFWYVVLGYLFLMFGYSWQKGKRNPKTIRSDDQYYISVKLLKYFKHIFIVVSILTFVYLLGSGGIFFALSKGAMMRYGFADSEISRFSVLQNIISMLPLLSVFFFYLFLVKQFNLSQNQIKLYFTVSLFINYINILIGSSRGAFVQIFIMYFLVYLYLTKKINVKLLIVLSGFVGLFIIYGKQLFFATATLLSGGSFIEAFVYLKGVRATDETPQLMLVLSEFRHGIASLERSFSEVERVGYNFFSDYLWSLLRIIPQRIVLQLVERPETISTLNTYALTGVSISSTPPGILAFNYYGMGPIGVVIGMFFYGLFGKKADLYYSNKMRFRKVYIIPYVFLAFNYGGFISNGDPNVYIYSIIWPIILTFLINKLEPISRNRRKIIL